MAGNNEALFCRIACVFLDPTTATFMSVHLGDALSKFVGKRFMQQMKAVEASAKFAGKAVAHGDISYACLNIMRRRWLCGFNETKDYPQLILISESPMDDRNELNRERPRSSLNLIVHEFLCQRVSEYVLLQNVRAEGWASTSGDAYFQRQRKSADNANSRTQKYFFKMMQSISKEMDDTTGIMSCLDVENGSAEVLDLCMAPGGFSDAVLQHYSTARISGISLPAGLGGHHVLLDLSDPRIRIEFTDITMLSSEMGTSVIQDNHPDAGRFSQHRPFANDSFNLVICDGHVLRTHPREPYREGVEMSRLITSQLVFGLHRIRPGGTLVILLHKLENWKSLKLLYTFSQFSKIQLFKPRHHHAIRSSFYLVATHVQPHMESAISAVENWKRTWFSATFGLRCEEAPPEHGIELILEEFGGRFIEVGKPVWRIQLEALCQSKFIQSSRKTAEIERARDR